MFPLSSDDYLTFFIETEVIRKRYLAEAWLFYRALKYNLKVMPSMPWIPELHKGNHYLILGRMNKILILVF